MPAEVKVLADSMNERGSRLTTFKVRVARCNWSEVMTHRAFSRNASSSRAIPVKRLIQDVVDDPYIPERFGLAKKGMQPGEFVNSGDLGYPELVEWWLDARDNAVQSALLGVESGLHKQVVNRILEPFQYINAVISATDWMNFLELRTAVDEEGNPQADIPIFNLATKIDELLDQSPTELADGEWHIPFSGGEGWDDLTLPNKLKVSVARVARVSYSSSHSLDGMVDKGIDKDIRLYTQLAESKHYSPYEHVAEARHGKFANYSGFRQLRWELEN